MTTEVLSSHGLHRNDLKDNVLNIETAKIQSLRPSQGVRIGTKEDGLDIIARHNGLVTVNYYRNGLKVADFFHLPANKGFSREIKDGTVISVQGGNLTTRRDFFFDYPENMSLKRLVPEFEPKRESC